MNLGVFLSVGDSFTDMNKSGQADRFINTYIKNYAKSFEKIYIFPYENEKWQLPKNVILIPKKGNLHRYIYSLLLPIIHRRDVEKCDVIRGFGLTSSVSSILLARPLQSKRTPFIFNWAYDYQEFLKIEKRYVMSVVLKVLEIIAFLRAKKIIIATLSKFNKLKGKKYIYIPNGVDLKIFKAYNKKRNGIVFVGRFEKQKNLFFLLRCISKLPTKYAGITFVGSGSQEKKLKIFAKKLNVNLTVKKPVKNSQLPKVLSSYSIFALTSYAEGSPKVLIEAMACGLVPVVTSFNTAGDIVKDGEDGYICEFSNEYTRKVLSLLLNDKIRQKMSQKSSLKIRNYFDLETLTKKEILLLKNAKSK